MSSTSRNSSNNGRDNDGNDGRSARNARHPHPPTPQTRYLEGRDISSLLLDSDFAQTNINLERLWSRIGRNRTVDDDTDMAPDERARVISDSLESASALLGARLRRVQTRNRQEAPDTSSGSARLLAIDADGSSRTGANNWPLTRSEAATYAAAIAAAAAAASRGISVTNADFSSSDRPRSRRRLSTSGRNQPGSSAMNTARYGRMTLPRLSQLPPLPGFAGPIDMFGINTGGRNNQGHDRQQQDDGDNEDHEEDEFDSDVVQRSMVDTGARGTGIGGFPPADDDDNDEDEDEDDDDDDDEDDMEHVGWDEFGDPMGMLGEPVDYTSNWFAADIGHTPPPGVRGRLLGEYRVGRGTRTPVPTARYEVGSEPQSSMIVRQTWNKDQAWKPHVYQEAVPNINNGVVPNAYQRERQLNLPGTTTERYRSFSVNPSIHMLEFDCTNADDMGHGSVNNIFTADRSLFITTRSKNVNLELSFISDQGLPHSRHCIVERIMIQSSMSRPPCTELMVFASSRRCGFSELAKYDNFTFAKYEALVRKIERRGQKVKLDDPLPIAYFWLSEEDRYKQMQALPQGKACKYIYIKMLRGHQPGQAMSLRHIRVFGWTGPCSFSEASIC
ncbi:hypothetical protein GGI12_002387 [Dipsacomyces acuminosporus]|nr:hypothetical protein GGI12_002387 [Dipsacomyces acuminosporus]